MAGEWNFPITAMIDADYGGLKQGLANAESQLRNFGNQVQKNARGIADGLENIGTKMSVAVTTPIVTGAGASVKAFGNFDTAMKGVEKTTGMTAAELQKLEDEFIALTREIPLSADEIANIGEVAGQLGVQGSANILEFTKTMAMLGTATNMSSTEAADGLARFANITGMTITDVDRLGSTIVALGNNLATTESEIVALGLRLASTGTLIGLNEAEIMGLAAAMSSLGITAEAGGSAMSRVMQKINTEVLGGGENLEAFAGIAGMTAEEFSQAWLNDPMTAITSFLNGLNEISQSGGDVTGTLNELGIVSVNEIDTLQRLAGNTGLLVDALDLANTSWKDNIALTEEAETAYASFESQMQLTKNAIAEAAIIIGETLAPYIVEIANKIKELAQRFAEADEGTQKMIMGILGVLAVLGPLMLGLSKTIKAVMTFSKVIKAIKGLSIVGGLTKVGGLFSKLSGVLGTVAGGFKAVIGAITGFLGPIGIVIAIIGALIGAFVSLYKTNETFRNKVNEIWGQIATKFEEVKETIINGVTGIAENVQSLPERIGSAVEGVKERFNNLKEAIVTKFTEIKEAITEFVTSIPGRFQAFGEQISTAITTALTELPYKIGYALGSAVGSVINFFLNLITLAQTYIPIFIDTIVLWFQQLPSRIGTFLLMVITNVISWASQMINQAILVGSQFVNNIITWFQQLPSRISTFLQTVISNVISWASQMISQARQAGQQFVTNVINFMQPLPSRIRAILQRVISNVISWGQNFRTRASSIARSVLNAVVNGLSSLPSRLRSIASNAVNSFVGAIRNGIGRVGAAARSLASGFIDGIKSRLKIGSPSKVMQDMGKWTGEGFERGIVQSFNHANKVLERMVPDFETMVSPSQTIAMNSILTAQSQFGGVNRQDYPSASPITLIARVNIGGYEFKDFVTEVTEVQSDFDRQSDNYYR